MNSPFITVTWCLELELLMNQFVALVKNGYSSKMHFLMFSSTSRKN